MHNLSRENEFYLKIFEWEWKWFPYQRLSSYPRFETEARENSEMAYCVVKFAWPCTLCSPHIRNSGFQNLKGLESRIQVRLTKTGIKYLELGIHGVDFRIQDYLRFLYMSMFTTMCRHNKLSGEVWRPIRYSVTLHLRDRRAAASLRYRNSTEITVLVCEQRKSATNSWSAQAIWVKRRIFNMNCYDQFNEIEMQR